MHASLGALLLALSLPISAGAAAQLHMPNLQGMRAYHASFLELDAPEKRFLAGSKAGRLLDSPLADGDLPDKNALSELILAESDDGATRFLDNYAQHYPALDPAQSLDDLDPRLREVGSPFLLEVVPTALSELIAQLDAPNGPHSDPYLQQSIDVLFADRTLLRSGLQHWKSALLEADRSIEIFYLDKSTVKFLYPQYSNAEFNALAFPSQVSFDNGLLLTEDLRNVLGQYKPRVADFSLEFAMYVILHELGHLLVGAGDESYVFDPYESVETYDVYSTARLDRNETRNSDNYVVLILRTLARLHEKGVIDLAEY